MCNRFYACVLDRNGSSFTMLKWSSFLFFGRILFFFRSCIKKLKCYYLIGIPKNKGFASSFLIDCKKWINFFLRIFTYIHPNL